MFAHGTRLSHFCFGFHARFHARFWVAEFDAR